MGGSRGPCGRVECAFVKRLADLLESGGMCRHGVGRRRTVQDLLCNPGRAG